jgi:hypothetical protein
VEFALVPSAVGYFAVGLRTDAREPWEFPSRKLIHGLS